jgi:hypothetical protein
MKRWSHLSSNLILIGVACISLAVLLLEITLTRVFSVVMWYHFAFLAISLALLGGAVGGVTVYALLAWVLARKWQKVFPSLAGRG